VTEEVRGIGRHTQKHKSSIAADHSEDGDGPGFSEEFRENCV
jgi:hypothetical protein